MNLGRFGVNQVCSLLGIAKNTYYNSRAPEESFLERYAYLKKYVLQVIEEHGSYGIRRIKQELLDVHNIEVGRDVLGKLLVIWGLQLKRQISTKKKSFIQKVLESLGDYSNLLKRICLTEPFQAITSDITEIEYGGGKAYLCVHKDGLGQMVYGYKLGLNMDRYLVIESYKMARDKIRKLLGYVPKMLCHSDQGSQYTSYEYVEEVQKDMLLSYSRKGTPTDNPGQESFFGRFKQENRSEMLDIETLEDLEYFVGERMKYYNESRLHTSIGNSKPLAFTKSYLHFLKTSSV